MLARSVLRSSPIAHTVARCRSGKHMCTIQASEPPSDEQACASIVDALLAEHKWQLLARDDFIQQTLDHLRAGVASDPQRAAIHSYTLALYWACKGSVGADQQNLAYTELFNYLYDIALRRYPDVCDDATQRALVCIFTQLAHCRAPGAFLAFALQYLMDAARAIRRQEDRSPWPLSVFADLDHNNHGEALPVQRQLDPAIAVLAGEQRSRFEELTNAFLQKHPRATLQLAALRLKFIDGLDEAAISQQLGKSVRSIYVLRSRAIEKLREEPEWRAFANELGLLSEE
jgi:RNA polymerase sigma factor (sigma-70 family)